jgi:hypothetical protein
MPFVHPMYRGEFRASCASDGLGRVVDKLATPEMAENCGVVRIHRMMVH